MVAYEAAAPPPTSGAPPKLEHRYVVGSSNEVSWSPDGTRLLVSGPFRIFDASIGYSLTGMDPLKQGHEDLASP